MFKFIGRMIGSFSCGLLGRKNKFGVGIDVYVYIL